MSVRFFIVNIFCLMSLANHLLSMKDEVNTLIKDFDTLNIQNKVYEDFSYNIPLDAEILASTKLGKNHNILIIQENYLVLKLVVQNVITNFVCECGEYVLPENKKNSQFSCEIKAEKELQIMYDDTSLKILLVDYIDFDDQEDAQHIPIRMASFALDNDLTFRAIMTSEGSGFFGVYNDTFCESGYSLERSDKVSVTNVDAIMIKDQEFLIAFVVNSYCINLFYWKVGDEYSHYINKINLHPNVIIKNIALGKDKKLYIKRENYEQLLCEDFSQMIERRDLWHEQK